MHAATTASDPVTKRQWLSRGFVCSLIGIGMTLFAWYGPWEWPAWPAFTALDLFFGHGGYAELPFTQRAAVLVGLIVLNVGSWGLATYAALAAVDRLRRSAGRVVE
jgi:hypothetical protein